MRCNMFQRRVRQCRRGDSRKLLRGERPHQLRQHRSEGRVSVAWMGMTRIVLHTRPEIGRRLFERMILQQSSEQEIAFPQCLHAAFVLGAVFVMRQQGSAFRFDEHGCHIEERTRLIHIALSVERAHVCKKFFRDGGQGHFGQFEASVGDHAQQHIERAGVVVQIDGETVRGRYVRHCRHGRRTGFITLDTIRCLHRPLRGWRLSTHGVSANVQATTPRATISRATSRYSCAVLWFGAYIVIGAAATVASGSLMDREITVWNTLSPNAS